MASFWDKLGNTAIGGLSGYLTGGGLGGALGGIAGAFKKKPLTFGSSLDTALAGAGAGALGKWALGALDGKLKPPSSSGGVAYGSNPPPESGIPSDPPFEGPIQPGWGDRALSGISGFGDRALNAIGLGSGQFRVSIPGINPEPGRDVLIGPRPGWGDRAIHGIEQFGRGALDTLGGLGTGAIGGLGGILGQARGLFGGPRVGVGTPENPEVVRGGAPGGGGRGIGFGQPRGGLQDLAILGGLGLGAYGLANPPGSANLEQVFEGAEGQTQSAIDARIAVEQARRQAAEQQFQTGRAGARTQLEQVLEQGTDESLRQAIAGRQAQLNRQGLLGGPSGALNEALAQEAGRIRREQLPVLTGFDLDTQRQLEAQRFGGLDAELGLGRAGLERQFGIGDLRRSASLRQKLLDLENDRARQRAIMAGASGALGYGFGGLPGAQAGIGLGKEIFGGGRDLESVLKKAQ